MVVGMRRGGVRVVLATSAWVVAVMLPFVAAAARTPAIAQSRARIHSDVLYATQSGIQLRLDVYSPPGEGPFPAVVVIPGGQWSELDKEKRADVPAYFAAHGIAAFAIEYRSAREFPYPAAIEDVRTAVRWVRAHAPEYDVDPSHLGAIGVSAGGHLAALVGTMGRGPLDQGARVSVVASWSGPMDLRSLISDSADPRIREPVRAFLGCSNSDSCASVARDASPITYVDPTDPPMMIVNSDVEVVPLDQAEAMTAALDEAGVDNRFLLALGGHGAGYGGGNKVLDRVIPFIAAWIEGRSVPAANETGGPVDGERAEEPKPGAEPAPDSSSPITPPQKDEKDVSLVGTSGAPQRNDQLNVVVLTIALLTLALVVVQFFVIAGLRRLVASRSSDEGSGEAGVEGA